MEREQQSKFVDKFFKTLITTKIHPFEETKIENNTIGLVTEYKYLGQIVSLEDKTEKELRIRRTNAWKAFWGQKYIQKGEM